MFFQFVSGKSPFVLTVPHDGERVLPGVAWRRQFIRWREKDYAPRDIGARVCLEGCAQRLEELGKVTSVLIFELDRGQLDLNRDPEQEPFVAGEKCLAEAYEAFYRTLFAEIQRVLDEYGVCLLIDFHSFEELPGVDLDIAFGTDQGRTCPEGWCAQIQSAFGSFRVGHSPDPARGISHRARGGAIVRRAGQRFASERAESRFGAIQIEFRRKPFFVGQPAVLGIHLADALSSLILP